MSKEVLTLLHDLYIGAQDKGVDVPPERGWKHDGIVKETRTFTFHKRDNELLKIFLSLPTKYDAKYENEAYTNFKVSPLEAFDYKEDGYLPIYMRLSFSDHDIERLSCFRCMNTQPQFYQMSEGRAIPALKNCSNIVEIWTPNYKRPITVSYDVVTSISKDGTTLYEDYIEQEQFTGTEVLGSTTKTSIKLNYNHPIIMLYAFIYAQDVEDVRILLDGKDHGLVMEQKSNGYYEFTFGHETSVNFSRIQNPVLHITTKNPQPDKFVNVFAISKQVVRRMDGIALAGYYN